MKKEQIINDVVDFDTMGHDQAMFKVEAFSKDINTESLKDRGCFCSCCTTLGIEPTIDLLRKVLHKNAQQITDIVTVEVVKSLEAQKLHVVLQGTILKGQAPAISEFVNAVSALMMSYNFLQRPSPGTPHKDIGNWLNYISFVDGLALVTDQAKETIREIFTTRVDTEARQEVFEGMKAVAEAMNTFNANLVKRGINLKAIVQDEYWFHLEGDLIAPDLSNIRYI